MQKTLKHMNNKGISITKNAKATKQLKDKIAQNNRF